VERLGHDGKVAHVARLTIYVSDVGELILSSGNVKLLITPEAASELLDELLRYASLFHLVSGVSSNGHVPDVTH
jgi:hypothetical protein